LAAAGCATPLQGNDDLAGTGTKDMSMSHPPDFAGRDLAGLDLSSGNVDLLNNGCPGKNLATDPMNCGTCNHVCMGAHVATNACANGFCTVGMCAQGYYDLNGNGGDGCECQQDSAESSATSQCAGAAPAGMVLESPAGMVTLSGNIVPLGDEDWYQVQAIDTPDANGACDMYHLQIKFTANPADQFRFDLVYDDCSTAVGCASGEGPTGLTTYDFAVTGDPNGGTECPCTNGATTASLHKCKDNSQTLRIRVYRKDTAQLSCDAYSLLVTNGM
jgi:hypothetical protein